MIYTSKHDIFYETCFKYLKTFSNIFHKCFNFATWTLYPYNNEYFIINYICY